MKTIITLESGRKIGKYIAYNPSSSEASEWWTEDSLDKLKSWLWSCAATHANTIKKIADGSYIIGDLDIYDVKKHPKAVEGLI